MVFIEMDRDIQKKIQEIKESYLEAEIILNNLKKRKIGKDEKLSYDIPKEETEENPEIYHIKIKSKDINLNRKIASKFEELFKGEEFYGNKPGDKMKLFSIEMKEFCQRYQKWINEGEKILDISWNNLTKEFMLYSSSSSAIQEAKNTIQKALDDEVKIECIDRRKCNVKKLRNFLVRESAEFLDDKEFDLKEIAEKSFIKGHQKSIERLKKMISSFLVLNPIKTPEYCPICFKEMNDDNFCLLYNCAHKFCKPCFIQSIEAEAGEFTISCPKCKQIVALKDIKELLPFHIIDKIIDKNFQLYMKNSSSIYKNCTTQGCKYIYPAGTKILDCEGCSESSCIKDPNNGYKSIK